MGRLEGRADGLVLPILRTLEVSRNDMGLLCLVYPSSAKFASLLDEYGLGEIRTGDMTMTMKEIDDVIELTSMRAEAIIQLLKYREEIDRKLTALGHEPSVAPVVDQKKKRGRPPGSKNRIPADIKAAMVELEAPQWCGPDGERSGVNDAAE